MKYMNGQDLGEKLLKSIRQMNAGLGMVVYSPIIAARQRSGLSQARFAALLGVSVRTCRNGSRAGASRAARPGLCSRWPNGIPRYCGKWPRPDQPGKGAQCVFSDRRLLSTG